MLLRTYTFICNIVLIVLLCILIFSGWFVTKQIHYELKHIEYSTKQLALISRISENFNKLNHLAISLFIFDNSDLNEIKRTKKKGQVLIKDLDRLIIEEYEFLKEEPQASHKIVEQEHVKNLRALLVGMIFSIDKVIAVRAEDPTKAKNIFIQTLKRELLPILSIILGNAISGERAEVQESKDKIKKIIIYYTTFALFLITLIIFLFYLSGNVVWYSVLPSIRKVTNGIENLVKGQRYIEILDKPFPSEIQTLVEKYNTLIKTLKERSQQHLVLKDNLESQIKARTLELTKANEKLKHLDNIKTQFLADVSHELRTPLTTIKGETEIRLRTDGHKEQEYRTTLARVKVLSDQMSLLVDDLLFIARSEKDEIYFDFKINDLEGISSAVVNSFEVIAKEQKKAIEITWPEEPLEISMDIFRLKQALSIILENALKYSYPETVIKVSISASDNNAVISVTNQGDDILDEDLPFVFERFYRGKQSKAKNGSGLGLSIAKWIIEKHKGTIDLSSHKNGLTEVTIFLPRTIM